MSTRSRVRPRHTDTAVARVPRRGGGAAAPAAPAAPAAQRKTGAHRRAAAYPAAYEDVYLDGLFTYCLSIMCEHDSATAALGEALALAERQHERGRRPPDPAQLRPWLYALARWACLRRLATQRLHDEGPGAGPATPRATDGDDARRRRRELAALAWPEAAGTSPEQREVLELAVRHQLPPREIARVLRLSDEAARTLLTAAACEVERTRGALAAVESGGCPAVAVLSGDDRRLLLGPRLRQELVRHVDECACCRLIAQRAMVSAGWPGAAASASAAATATATLIGSRASRLPVLAAPRGAVNAARLAVRRARAQHAPRFDRAGFPLPERDRAALRERLRSRAVATTVVAGVLAAPVLALWAACRGAPLTGDLDVRPRDGAAAVAGDGDPDELDGGGGDSDGGGGASAVVEREREGQGAGGAGEAGASADADADAGGDGGTGTVGGQGGTGSDPSVAPDREEPDGEGNDGPSGGGGPGGAGPGEGGAQPGTGELTAHAESTETGTRVTLTASGDGPVDWTAVSDAEWLVLSVNAGTLRPGETAVIEVAVDSEREPSGPWRGRISVEPAATVITVEGRGEDGPSEEPTTPPDPEPDPTTPQPSDGPSPSD